jgi:hypothetical protein
MLAMTRVVAIMRLTALATACRIFKGIIDNWKGARDPPEFGYLRPVISGVGPQADQPWLGFRLTQSLKASR